MWRITAVLACACTALALTGAASSTTFGVADDTGKYADDGGLWFDRQLQGANLTEERCAELDVTKVTKDELVKMKRGAILVNISRGPIAEEAALVEALRSGHLAGAGLDVFDREPLPADHPFRSLDNVVVTPHVGYVTEHLFRTAWQRMAEDVAAYLAGVPIRVVTDPADCPPMAPQ